jgi:hypothetical protein
VINLNDYLDERHRFFVNSLADHASGYFRVKTLLVYIYILNSSKFISLHSLVQLRNIGFGEGRHFLIP